MPTVKSNLNILSSSNLNGGAGAVTFSPWLDMRDEYSAIMYVKITNPAFDASQGVICEMELSPDQVSGNEFPFGCREVADKDASAVSKFTFRAPLEARFARMKFTHTDQVSVADVLGTRVDQV